MLCSVKTLRPENEIYQNVPGEHISGVFLDTIPGKEASNYQLYLLMGQERRFLKGYKTQEEGEKARFALFNRLQKPGEIIMADFLAGI